MQSHAQYPNREPSTATRSLLEGTIGSCGPRHCPCTIWCPPGSGRPFRCPWRWWLSRGVCESWGKEGEDSGLVWERVSRDVSFSGLMGFPAVIVKKCWWLIATKYRSGWQDAVFRVSMKQRAYQCRARSQGGLISVSRRPYLNIYGLHVLALSKVKSQPKDKTTAPIQAGKKPAWGCLARGYLCNMSALSWDLSSACRDCRNTRVLQVPRAIVLPLSLEQ